MDISIRERGEERTENGRRRIRHCHKHSSHNDAERDVPEKNVNHCEGNVSGKNRLRLRVLSGYGGRKKLPSKRAKVPENASE